jgi:gas vesicle protein
MRFNRFLGFLAGLGAGAAVTLFFAPKSGKAMRRYVGRRIDDGREYIEHGAAKAQDVGDDMRVAYRKMIKGASQALAAALEAGRTVAAPLR